MTSSARREESAEEGRERTRNGRAEANEAPRPLEPQSSLSSDLMLVPEARASGSHETLTPEKESPNL